jgi:hypothetical protein
MRISCAVQSRLRLILRDRKISKMRLVVLPGRGLRSNVSIAIKRAMLSITARFDLHVEETLVITTGPQVLRAQFRVRNDNQFLFLDPLRVPEILGVLAFMRFRMFRFRGFVLVSLTLRFVPYWILVVRALSYHFTCMKHYAARAKLRHLRRFLLGV